MLPRGPDWNCSAFFRCIRISFSFPTSVFLFRIEYLSYFQVLILFFKFSKFLSHFRISVSFLIFSLFSEFLPLFRFSVSFPNFCLFSEFISLFLLFFSLVHSAKYFNLITFSFDIFKYRSWRLYFINMGNSLMLKPEAHILGSCQTLDVNPSIYQYFRYCGLTHSLQKFWAWIFIVNGFLNVSLINFTINARIFFLFCSK